MDRKLLGQGINGCVYSPAIPCNNEDENELKSKNFVSKVMSSSNASNEYNDYKIFYDLSQKQFRKLSDFCIIPKQPPCNFEKEKYKELLKNCEPIYKSTDIMLINQPNGGTSVKNYLKTLFSYMNSQNRDHGLYLNKLIEFLKAFQQLIKGLYILRNNGIIHMDIKADNIVYNDELNKFYLIDFGCSRRVPLLDSKKYVLSLKDLSNYIENAWIIDPDNSLHWPYEYTIVCGEANKQIVRTLNVSNLYPALNAYNLLNYQNIQPEHLPDVDEYEENLLSFLRNTAKGHDLWGLCYALKYIIKKSVEHLRKIKQTNKKYNLLYENFNIFNDYLINYRNRDLNKRISSHNTKNNNDIRSLEKEYSKFLKNIETDFKQIISSEEITIIKSKSKSLTRLQKFTSRLKSLVHFNLNKTSKKSERSKTASPEKTKKRSSIIRFLNFSRKSKGKKHKTKRKTKKKQHKK